MLDQKRYLNKKGSQTIMLAMVFVALMMCITMAIGLARALTVKSECEVFGRLWAKAILSEYDVHLFEDYRIMAYFGNEAEVQKRIDSYIMYSTSNKLDASINKSSAELVGYELGDPDNFRKALKLNSSLSAIDLIKAEKIRNERSEDNTNEEYDGRKIKNEVVLDTLPSRGMTNNLDIQGLYERAKDGSNVESLKASIENFGLETAFVLNYLGNHVTKGIGKDGYFCNEWEYIVNGKCDDEANFKVCKGYIFAIRNAMNIAYLFKDPEKKAIIATISECLTPGATGVLTQAVVAEMWAAIETEKDIEALLDNERVPFMKNRESWKTDISSVLSSKDIADKLDDEGKKLLEEAKGDILDMDGAEGSLQEIKEGQSYDEYLLLLMSLMNDNTKTLRIMDLVQINMKYRYYEDFNMMEYYLGTRFNIKANGKNYEFEESYK